jgi:hypothetical protein
MKTISLENIRRTVAVRTGFSHWFSGLLTVLCLTSVAQADSRYTVFLDSDDNQSIVIGELTVSAPGEDNGYQFTLSEQSFSDHFLAMRPFKCLTHQQNMLCYLPYSYTSRRNISRSDLTDLEYDLLFIARNITDYGIDPWNGRYYQLRWQGEAIQGDSNEVDLNVLAAPPEEGNFRPIGDEDLTPAEVGVGWQPSIRIEPTPD